MAMTFEVPRNAVVENSMSSTKFLPHEVYPIEKPSKKLMKCSSNRSKTRKQMKNKTKNPIGNRIKNEELYSTPTENEEDSNDKYVTMDCYNTPDEYLSNYSNPFDYFLSSTNSFPSSNTNSFPSSNTNSFPSSNSNSFSSANSNSFSSANSISSLTDSFSSTNISMPCSNDDGYFSMEPSETNADNLSGFSFSNETNFQSCEIKNMTESERKVYLAQLEKELEKYVCNDPFANYRIESY